MGEWQLYSHLTFYGGKIALLDVSSAEHSLC